jgi:predicted amidohydrolase YtcJ
VVLSADVFNRDAVPDEGIRRIRPAMTVVGGRIVYGDAAGLR